MNDPRSTRIYDTTPAYIAWDALTAMSADQLRALFPDGQRIIAAAISTGAANLVREAAEKTERAS